MKLCNNIFNHLTLQSILSDLSHAVGPERIGPFVTDRVFWRADTRQPHIALTFDDGPHPEYTPELLEILATHNVPATFFLIGRHIEAHRVIAEKIVAAGHEIANHTYSHPVLFRLPDEEIHEEIHRTDQLLKSLNGTPPRFLRPPMGLFSRRVLNIVEQHGYITVVGDVYPRDPHMPGRHKIVERVLSRVTKGSIIILHDGGNSHFVDRSQTMGAVKTLIPILKERGFDFVKLSQLLLAGK